MLVSLQRWTPMYWSQERYGMLVPLLALPLRDPLANLMVQRALLVLAGLSAVVLLARWAVGGRAALLCGLLGAAALFLLPAPWRFEYLGDQPYGLSAALAVAGLLTAAPGGPGRRSGPRIALGLALVLAAHWVNAAAGLFLVPVAVARAVADRRRGAPAPRGRLWTELALLAAGLALGQATIRLYPVLTGTPLRLDTGVFPLSAWPGLTGRLLASAAEGAGARWALPVGAAALLGLLLPWPRGEEERAPRLAALARAALLALAALASVVPTAALRWVSANAFHPRYVALQLVLVHLAALSLLAEPLARLAGARGRGVALAVALALVPAAAVAAYGPPSLAQVKADLDARTGARTEDVLAARCDLVTGDYWSVWTTVWHAGWVARQRGLPAPYGLCYRATPTQRFWSARPRDGLRICAVQGEDAEVERWLRAYRLWPVRELEARGTVRVVQPR